MKRLVTTALLLLLLLAALPLSLSAAAQSSPRIAVTSQFIINRYGYATVNETVRFTNNGTSPVQIPSITFGLGNLSSNVVMSNLTGSGFSLASASTGGPFTVTSSLTLQANSNATFVLSSLLNGVVSTAKNGSLRLLVLTSPSITPKVDSLHNVIQMPPQTAFRSVPPGMKANLAGSNNTYSSTATETSPSTATTAIRVLAQSSFQDFNPLKVYFASRTITAGPSGSPLVTDKVKFQNMGNNTMSLLYVNLLALPGVRVTILTPTEPRLINPVTIPLTSSAINIALFAAGYPNNGVAAGTNFTVTYQYPLGSSYYSVSGGKVSLNIPDTPPVKAFIDEFVVSLSLPQGATASQSAPTTLTNVSPWQQGTTSFAYGLSIGWTVDAGVPGASIVFVLLLVGLFAARTTTAEEAAEEEEESSSELASDMINAFDEKTTLINGLWSEISAKDPNEVDKEYFDELRGRLDSFRSRALQRLNEVKQKSASQKFSDVVNQIQATEREVDRAAKDKLNLYQQYYMRQMRKEVYDRLLPQYTKRLEKALNQLSDELHTVQREAKLL